MTTKSAPVPIAVHDEKQAKPVVALGAPGAALMPTNLDEAFRMAKALSMSGEMVPDHFRSRPEATMAAILRGMEVGLSPMQALSSIAVINGRACLWGDAIPALMQRAGHHIDVEITGEGDEITAIATLTRGDTGMTVVRSFSIADAKVAGLLSKKGPWQNYRKRMLAHRARGWAARDGAADALMGLQIAEEVQDTPMRDVTPTPSAFAQRVAAAREISDETGSTAENGQSEPAQDDIPDADPSDDRPGHSEAFISGRKCAEEGMFSRADCPHTEDPDAAAEWFAGFDSVEEEAH